MPRVLTLLLVLSAACSNAGGPEPQGDDAPREPGRSLGSPLPAPPEVWLSPADGWTNVSLTPTISIRSARPVERSVLEQVAAEANVVTWPGRSVVETETSIGEGLISPTIEPTIRLTPKQPLALGWYALEVHSLVPPLRWPDNAGIVRDGDAGRSRFKVGSAPVVLHIWVCEKAAGRTKLLLSLSETVAVIQPLEDHFKVESSTGTLDCELGEAPAELYAVCDLAGVKSVKVTLSDSFAEVGNPTVPAEGASAQFEFDPRALPEVTTGCKIYKP
ncbi:MAG TPA: hypothetical protein VJV78_40780 [Polyangiales bacterium]|nr:hypothetical protein [Polyangiales bacterium]